MNESGLAVARSKAEYVAHQLLEKIISADLTPGSRVGTEADLLQEHDVSRPTLRESLRILEAQGVLELRPGPKGGILVTKPGLDILAHSLSVYLRLNDVPFSAVLHAREAIEPALAGAAAENATAEDLTDLQASIDRMKRLTGHAEFITENRTFHSLVARASGNRVMEIFWSTISILAVGEQHGIKYTAANRRVVIEAHQTILDAITARDANKSAELMTAHVSELEKLVKRKYQHLLDQATTVISRQGRRIE